MGNARWSEEKMVRAIPGREVRVTVTPAHYPRYRVKPINPIGKDKSILPAARPVSSVIPMLNDPAGTDRDAPNTAYLTEIFLNTKTSVFFIFFMNLVIF